MQNAAYCFAILERKIYFSFKNPIDPYFVGCKNLNGKYVIKFCKKPGKNDRIIFESCPCCVDV